MVLYIIETWSISSSRRSRTKVRYLTNHAANKERFSRQTLECRPASIFNTLICCFGKIMQKNEILFGRARDEKGGPIERFMRRNKMRSGILPSNENFLILHT